MSNRIAGSDTTASSVTFALLLLLENPSKLKKLIEELDDAFPYRNDQVTLSKTQELPYLNAVINEALRVKPVAVGGGLPFHPNINKYETNWGFRIGKMR